MPSDKRRIDVMVSSTTRDLGDHRRRVGEVITRFQFVPRIMDLDSTTGKDGVTYSLNLVDEAEIYILLLGFRYGHIPDDPRNPTHISMTQMEYERALEREARGQVCVLPFVMADDHPVMHDHVETDAAKRTKLDAFRAMVLDKQIAFFSSIDDLEKQVMQALSMSECVQKLRDDPGVPEEPVQAYLRDVHKRIHGQVIEQFFVDLSGDLRPNVEHYYDDPYLDSLMQDFGIELDADHHQPDVHKIEHVPKILDQLTQSKRAVLVGEPGAGKSFTMRRLVLRYLNRYDEYRRVPIFVPLNAFKGEMDFEAYIRVQMGALSPYYRRLRDEGRLVLICDALNEMPRTASTDGRELLPEVREVLHGAPLFVVSCRVRDYRNDLDELKLERLEVRDMELPAIREFVGKYLRDEGDAFWQRIGGSEKLFEFWQAVQEKDESERFWQPEAGIPSYTSGDSDRAWRAIWEGAKLIPLARNPYMARVICTLHKRQQLPENRAELYRAFVTDLYEREKDHAAKRGQSFPARDALEDFLTELAEALQAAGSTVLKLDAGHDEALLQAALDATLLTQDGEDVRFTHQLLQEYFSAKTLAQRLYQDEDPQTIITGELNVWRETALMLAEFTGEAERVARWVGQASPWLAVETLQRLTDDERLANISDETRQSLITSARANLDDPNPVGRAQAYRVLGLFDVDERSGVGVLPSPLAPLSLSGEGKRGRGLRGEGLLLPDIDWVTIPAGEFTYQDGKMPLDYDFQISRYPVTYAQFQAFIDDPEGFYDLRWWQGLAIPDGHNDAPGDQGFKYWNHPRERVSWYDAMAFCRWFSWRLLTLTPQPPLPQASEGELFPLSAEVKQKMTAIAQQLRRDATPSEAKLWDALRNRQLEGRKFRRQHPIGAFVLDFYCASDRLAVEVDGSIHAEQTEADAQRQALLEGLGIRFIRVTATEVETRLSDVLARIRSAFLPSPVFGRGAGGEGVLTLENFDLMNPDTWPVRLPTEQEWEKAARGTDGREYPYAGAFDAAKGNTSETGIRQTSAVGIFPAGASPYGVLDMSGNVWEWCLTDYGNPQERATDENIRSNTPRVLRGGSWNSYQDFARAAFRRNGSPYFRNLSYGFRVCASPFS